MSLLIDFSGALREVARVAEHGAEKYSRGGWKHVEDGVNRYTAAGLRHRFAGDDPMGLDSDSGLLHKSHEAWNSLAALELALIASEEVDNE